MARRPKQISPALQQAAEAVRRDEESLNVTGGAIPRQLLQRAADMVEPMVRAFLLANLRAAGIQQRTGALYRAISQVIVGIGKGGLVYRLPGSLPAKTHRQAAALNYGSVRVPKADRHVVDLPTGRTTFRRNRDVVGERAKRTLKKIATGVPVSDRARRAVASGRKIHGHRIPGISVGRATVTPPKPFMRLSDSQRATVRSAFLNALAQLRRAS